MKRLQVVETMNVLGLACLILGAWASQPNLFWACGAFLALGVFPNRLAHWVTSAWLGFAEGIGKITSKIVLTLVYFLALVPLAWLCRIFTRDTRKYFFERNQPSSFISIEKPFSPEDFTKTW